ncbi:MAG: hypothetical protein LBD02_01275 [Christensenellaceae bacterium]|jgi:hypothetical protein|nr:hypothetical protein [Christensenellaceae bacterium]
MVKTKREGLRSVNGTRNKAGLAILLLSVMLLSVAVPAFAITAKTWTIDELDMSLDIPLDWYVITRDKVINSTALSEKVGINISEFQSIDMPKNNSWLDAIVPIEPGEAMSELVIMCDTETTLDALWSMDDLDEADTQALLDGLVAGAKQKGMRILNNEMCEYNGQKYALVSVSVEANTLRSGAQMYTTVVNGRPITVSWRTYGNTSFNSYTVYLFEKAMKSIVFDVKSKPGLQTASVGMTRTEAEEVVVMEMFSDWILTALSGAIVGGVTAALVWFFRWLARKINGENKTSVTGRSRCTDRQTESNQARNTKVFKALVRKMRVVLNQYEQRLNSLPASSDVLSAKIQNIASKSETIRVAFSELQTEYSDMFESHYEQVLERMARMCIRKIMIENIVKDIKFLNKQEVVWMFYAIFTVNEKELLDNAQISSKDFEQEIKYISRQLEALPSVGRSFENGLKAFLFDRQHNANTSEKPFNNDGSLLDHSTVPVVSTSLEEEAINREVTVEQLVQIKQMEEELATSRKTRIDALMEEASEIKKKYPSFDAVSELRDERFAAMVKSGVSQEEAFLTLHPEVKNGSASKELRAVRQGKSLVDKTDDLFASIYSLLESFESTLPADLPSYRDDMMRSLDDSDAFDADDGSTTEERSFKLIHVCLQNAVNSGLHKSYRGEERPLGQTIKHIFYESMQWALKENIITRRDCREYEDEFLRAYER